jgi:hypothetical protein
MAARGRERMLVAVERHMAAIKQEGAMQTNPISSEMSARVHFEALAHEAQQRRAARLAEARPTSDPQARTRPSLRFGWLRLLTTRFSSART